MKRNTIIVTGAIVVMALLALGAWSLFSSRGPATVEPENLTIGIPMMLDSSALVYIADDQGYFSDNGLNATINVYDAGLFAVEDMLHNKNDIAVATEFVLVGKALEQENVTGIGSIAKYQIHYLIGRKDHGIANVSDLKGKKIGFAYGTSGEFFLSRYLELNGISLSEITPVDVKPAQYAGAIANESIDAVLAWDPHVDTIKEQLGQDIVVWPAQSGQQGYWMAICREDWKVQHPETIRRFLKAIDQAATFVIYHPDEAKAIVQKRSGADSGYIATIWANTQFSLSLDQSLITAMEDESRWMIKNNLTTVSKTPDFRDYIYREGMETVKPEAVNIV